MQSNIWLVASAWMALALAASLISIWVGISVALIEILVGIVAGNFLGIHRAPWIDFLATFGSGLLTFLAGAEIDPDALKRHLKPALVIGMVGVIGSAIVATLIAQRFFHPVIPEALTLDDDTVASPPLPAGSVLSSSGPFHHSQRLRGDPECSTTSSLASMDPTGRFARSTRRYRSPL